MSHLKAEPKLLIEPADGIDRVEVSALDFFAAGGGFAKFERRGDDETIYQFLARNFGDASPLKTPGWTITGATLRIFLAAQDGKRKRTLIRGAGPVELPTQTTLGISQLCGDIRE